MAGKSEGEIQYPSSSLVKNLNILAATLGIVSIALDAVVPIAQQLGKKKQAKAGLERAITLTIFLTAIRTVPRIIREVRKLKAQMRVQVAA